MNYKDRNDNELLYMIREDDEDAFTMVLQKYRPVIDKFAKQYLPAASNMGLDYADLYQEGLIGIYSALNSYMEESSTLLYTYLNVCIKRRMQTLLRRHSSKRQEVLNNALLLSERNEKGSSLLERIALPENALDEVITSELVEKLIEFQHSLDIRSSCVFELKLNGFSIAEIAHLLDISFKSVSNIVYNNRRKLSVRLERLNYV